MEPPEDLATLWTAAGRRCVLAPLDGQWQIRIEDGGSTVRSHLAATSDEAVAIADGWFRDTYTDPSPFPPLVAPSPYDPGDTRLVGALAQQLLEKTVRTGPAAMLAILDVCLTGTLTALHDDPRLTAVAPTALADVGEASRLLSRAVARLADSS